MAPMARRSFMVVLSAASAGFAATARAVDALPDARFVGFAQAVNDFGVGSGNLALARSGNENVRGYATRAIAEHNEAASELAKSRQEAGVAFAPDGRMGPNVQNLLARLSQLQGPEFDAAFAQAQLTVQTDAGRPVWRLLPERRQRPAAPLRPEVVPQVADVPRVRAAPGGRPVVPTGADLPRACAVRG